eukprot:gene10927-biopygen11193
MGVHYAVNAVAVNTRSTSEMGVKQFYRFAVWYDLRPVFPASEHSLELWATFLANLSARLKENSKRKKLRIGPKELASIFFDGKVDPSKKNVLLCWLAFGGCFSKAIVTAKKQDTFSRSSVMLRGSVRRGVATLAFVEHVPRGLVKHWGDWVSDAVDEYHGMTLEQRLAIPRGYPGDLNRATPGLGPAPVAPVDPLPVKF